MSEVKRFQTLLWFFGRTFLIWQDFWIVSYIWSILFNLSLCPWFPFIYFLCLLLQLREDLFIHFLNKHSFTFCWSKNLSLFDNCCCLSFLLSFTLFYFTSETMDLLLSNPFFVSLAFWMFISLDFAFYKAV